jgi:hypothetical protein
MYPSAQNGVEQFPLGHEFGQYPQQQQVQQHSPNYNSAMGIIGKLPYYGGLAGSAAGYMAQRMFNMGR